MTVKRTLTLVLTFRRDDADTATRTVRALLKWLLRSWGMRAESYHWEDDTDGGRQSHSSAENET